MSQKIDFEFLKPLTELLRSLAGVAPRNAAGFLENLHMRAALADEGAVHVNGTEITAVRLNELFVSEGGIGRMRVTPEGAKLLVELYEMDALPMKAPKRPKLVGAQLLDYIASEPKLREESAERQAWREGLRKAHEAYVDDPASLPESEFSYALLNDIFFRHAGPGGAVLDIGGRRVTKTVTTRFSNTAKTSDTAVTFQWVGDNGEPKVINKDSIYAGNRRNDPTRNWGLHE